MPWQSVILTTGLAGALHWRDPQVGGAGVKDDSEGLRWATNGDHTIVGQLEETHEQLDLDVCVEA